MFLRHPILSLITAGYLAIVGWITLGPQPLDEGATGLLFRVLDVAEGIPVLSWIGYYEVEFAANVLMFLPIGLFLLLLLGRRRWWLAILLGIVLTVSIETAQLFLPERVSDVRDIIANSIGGTIGVILALLVTAPKARSIRHQKDRERILSV